MAAGRNPRNQTHLTDWWNVSTMQTAENAHKSASNRCHQERRSAESTEVTISRGGFGGELLLQRFYV